MRTKTIITLAIAAVCALPLLAAQPNHLQGTTFDTPDAVASWKTIPATRTSEVNEAITGWIGVDALGSGESGSMVINGTGKVMQCAPVTVGQAYDFGARVLVTTRDGLKTPAPFLKLTFYSDAQCSGAVVADALSDNAAKLPGRYTAVSGKAQVAPAGANSALMSVIIPDSGDLGLLRGLRPSIYVDDVFLQETGSCVPDDKTMCFARDTVRATMRVFDAQGVAADGHVIQTSPTTGYFFTISADLPDVTIKTYDFVVDGSGARWIVVSGLTDQKIEITVEDVKHHDVRTYTNVNGHVMEPIVDAFLNP
jgi:hypothetical protein